MQSQHCTTDRDLKIVLVGPVGCGKTSTANGILGKDLFPESQIKTCQAQSGKIEGRAILIIDTPGLRGTAEDRMEIQNYKSLGPSIQTILLFVINLEEGLDGKGQLYIQWLEECAGADSVNMMVLFTRREKLTQRKFELCLNDEENQKMIRCCKGRYCTLNSKGEIDTIQLEKLMRAIDTIIKTSGSDVAEEPTTSGRPSRSSATSNASLKAAKLGPGSSGLKTSGDQQKEATQAPKKDARLSERESHLAPKSSQINKTLVLSLPFGKSLDYTEPSDSKSSTVSFTEQPVSSEAAGASQPRSIATIPLLRPKSVPSTTVRVTQMSMETEAGVEPALAAGALINDTDASEPHLDVLGQIMPVRDTPEIRIVLLGKSGSGKSASANTILGREVFHSEFTSSSVTAVCQREEANISGWHVIVVDTPGLFDTNVDIIKCKKQIEKCLDMCPPGPHVFLLVLKLGMRHTDEEMLAVKWIRDNFGEQASQFTMVLFTCADQLRGKPVEKIINKHIQDLIQDCGGGYFAINNIDTDQSQTIHLLEKIEAMVRKNNGAHYTKEVYKETQRKLRANELAIIGLKNGVIAGATVGALAGGPIGALYGATSGIVLGGGGASLTSLKERIQED